jgi:hypothetical protein
MKKYILLFLISASSISNAGLFSSKEGKTFQTRGTAVILSNGAITIGVEKKDIPIPSYIDVSGSAQWNGLRHDSESGWTKCRLPLKGELSWQGVKDRDLVFDCKPLTYF